MPDSVTLVGADDAARDMARWADQVAPEVVAKSRPMVDRVASRVSSRVPVLTGALAASVELVELSPEQGRGVSIGDGLDYAGWIEFGGSRGRPLIPQGRYLYPTAIAAEDEFVALAEDIAEQSVGRFSWSKAS